MCNRDKKLVEEKFNWDRVAKGGIQFINGLLSGKALSRFSTFKLV